MKRKGWYLTMLLLAVCLLCSACKGNHKKEEGQTSTPVPTATTAPQQGTGPGLKEIYKDRFPFGVGLSKEVFEAWGTYGETVLAEFNSITIQDELMPEALLQQMESQAGLPKTYESPVLSFAASEKALKIAEENGLEVRLYALICCEQTPRWFFTEDYSNQGALVSGEVMQRRMESYIQQVFAYLEGEHPGLVTTVDVVSGAVAPEQGGENGLRVTDNLWYETIGADYLYDAFLYADRYAGRQTKLFYSDFDCMQKRDAILAALEASGASVFVDGIGMQCHLTVNSSIASGILPTIAGFCDAGYEVQLTQLGIGIADTRENTLYRQGVIYKMLLSGVCHLQEEGYAVTGVTVWGLSDAFSDRAEEAPLLFDESLNRKPAYLGAALDASFPQYGW